MYLNNIVLPIIILSVLLLVISLIVLSFVSLKYSKKWIRLTISSLIGALIFLFLLWVILYNFKNVQGRFKVSPDPKDSTKFNVTVYDYPKDAPKDDSEEELNKIYYKVSEIKQQIIQSFGVIPYRFKDIFDKIEKIKDAMKNKSDEYKEKLRKKIIEYYIQLEEEKNLLRLKNEEKISSLRERRLKNEAESIRLRNESEAKRIKEAEDAIRDNKELKELEEKLSREMVEKDQINKELNKYILELDKIKEELKKKIDEPYNILTIIPSINTIYISKAIDVIKSDDNLETKKESFKLFKQLYIDFTKDKSSDLKVLEKLLDIYMKKIDNILREKSMNPISLDDQEKLNKKLGEIIEIQESISGENNYKTKIYKFETFLELYNSLLS